MLDLLVGILHLVVFPGGLFALALGLFLKGCDRRVEARLQRRVGPPLIQPFLDLVKLSTKEVIIPTSAAPAGDHGRRARSRRHLAGKDGGLIWNSSKSSGTTSRRAR